MGDVLAELEVVLRSKPTKDKITPSEELVLQTCKARAIRDFTFGACLSSVIVWTATRNLTHGHRFNTSVGSAMLSGMWRFNRSLNSCLNEVLQLEGSRMQRELANIILTKHHDNSSRVKLVRKYFYPEEVFSDLSPEKPFLRWRYRNLYYDNSAPQRTQDPEDGSFQEKPDKLQQPKQSMRNLGDGELAADPLECIFGQGEVSKENAHSDKSSITRRQLRAHKRAHRRHRTRHADMASNETSYDRL